MVNIGRLFCCFSSDEGQVPEINHTTSSGPLNSAPAKGDNPSNDNKAVERDTNPSPQPPSNELSLPGKSDARPQSYFSKMPLDYVNPGDHGPEEDLIIGRRHSVSVIASQDFPPPSASTEKSENVEDGEIIKYDGNNMGADEDSDSLARGFSNSIKLLPPLTPEMKGRKCLVLDLDETLVHSSFKEILNADFVIAVDVDDTVHDVYVTKRPGVDEFLKKVSEIYEVVVFTASVAKYGDPLLDRLDPNHYIHHRLFRDSCLFFRGGYIKNLTWLGRDLNDTIIIDNSPAAYSLHPYNAVPVSSWFSDIHDNELLDMVPILEDLADPKVFNVARHLRYEW